MIGRLTAAAAVLFLIATGCSNDNVKVEATPKVTTASTGSTVPDNETTTTEPPADLPPLERLVASIEATMGRALRGQMRLEGEIVEASGEGLHVNFQADAQGDIEAMLAEGEDPSGPQLTVRIVDGQTYAGFPGAFTAQFPDLQMFRDFQGETAWLTVNPELAEDFALACPSPLAQLGAASATCDSVADLRDIADTAEEATVVGDEEVRGVSTTRLQFIVPIADLPAAGAGEDGLDGDLGGMFEGNVSVDVWIDDDMLLRKLVVDLSSIFGGFAEAFGVEDDAADIATYTWQHVIEYYEFDDSISIEAPAPELLIGDYADIRDQFDQLDPA